MAYRVWPVGGHSQLTQNVLATSLEGLLSVITATLRELVYKSGTFLVLGKYTGDFWKCRFFLITLATGVRSVRWPRCVGLGALHRSIDSN